MKAAIYYRLLGVSHYLGAGEEEEDVTCLHRFSLAIGWDDQSELMLTTQLFYCKIEKSLGFDERQEDEGGCACGWMDKFISIHETPQVNM